MPAINTTNQKTLAPVNPSVNKINNNAPAIEISTGSGQETQVEQLANKRKNSPKIAASLKCQRLAKALTSGLLIACSFIGLSRPAAAEYAVYVTDRYMIDLDNRSQFYDGIGWRHVRFRISTENDRYWRHATAACNPYDVNVPAYGWGWKSSGGYPSGTVAGDIARAACNW